MVWIKSQKLFYGNIIDIRECHKSSYEKFSLLSHKSDSSKITEQITEISNGNQRLIEYSSFFLSLFLEK